MCLLPTQKTRQSRVPQEKAELDGGEQRCVQMHMAGRMQEWLRDGSSNPALRTGKTDLRAAQLGPDLPRGAARQADPAWEAHPGRGSLSEREAPECVLERRTGLNGPGNASLGFQLRSLVSCLRKTFYIGCFFCPATAPYSSIRCCRLGRGLAP